MCTRIMGQRLQAWRARRPSEPPRGAATWGEEVGVTIAVMSPSLAKSKGPAHDVAGGAAGLVGLSGLVASSPATAAVAAPATATTTAVAAAAATRTAPTAALGLGTSLVHG